MIFIYKISNNSGENAADFETDFDSTAISSLEVVSYQCKAQHKPVQQIYSRKL